MSSDYDKRMQSIYSIETYAHRMSEDLVCKKEEITCNKIINQYNNVWLWLYYKRRQKRT